MVGITNHRGDSVYQGIRKKIAKKFGKDFVIM